MSDVIAMLRGGGGGGSVGPPGPQGPQGIPGVNGATWYTGAVNPVTVVGAVNGDYYLNTLTGDIFKLVTAIWTLQGNIMGPAGPGSDVLVYQWANSFDPTAGSGVAVPAGKAAFGWCAETSPGAGDGTLWIYTGPTPKKWAPCAFIFNLAQNWTNILGVSIAYYGSPAYGMPVISYNNALSADGPEIDVAIDSGSLSFKIHLRALINGTDPGDHATIQGIVNGITTPNQQTLSGESTSALASDQICSIHTIGPMGSGVTGAKPGDFVDVTIESYYPATNDTPQVVRFTSVVVRASGEMITNVAALAIPPTNPVTAVASVGIKLFDDSETLTLTFDHTHATVALLQNGY
jgi:hypothetical protein